MSKRKAISKRLRYAILERDGYACRYCGAEASPHTRLHVDHRMPVSRGGTNDFENLITACPDCNLGKHAFLPIKAVPNQRGAAFATLLFGRACERFGDEAFQWRWFCMFQDFCYSEDRPEDLLAILRDSETFDAFIDAIFLYSGYPQSEYWGDEG